MWLTAVSPYLCSLFRPFPPTAAAVPAPCPRVAGSSPDQQLVLYGLYKQASFGDCSSQWPGLFDPTGRAKWYVDVLSLSSIFYLRRLVVVDRFKARVVFFAFCFCEECISCYG